MTPKLSQNQKSEFEGTIENKSYSTTRIDPKAVFETYPSPKNSPLGPPKEKSDPKIKSKVKIEENIENQSC